VQEFLIAIAGPLVNVVIAFGLALFLGADLNAEHLAAVESTKVSLLDRLAEVNLSLALFNMIPAFPMDGGRVLRALLAIRLGHVRATEIAAKIGQALAFALGFAALIYQYPLLIFIAIFVYLAAASEAQLVAVRAMSRDVPVSAAMMTGFATLTPDEHFDAAVETLLHTSQSAFPVIDADRRTVEPRQRHPRPQAAWAGCACGPGDDDGYSNHRSPPHPRRGLSPVAGKIRAGGRRCRYGRPPCRTDHLGNGGRNVDGAQRSPARRPTSALEPSCRRLNPSFGRRTTAPSSAAIPKARDQVVTTKRKSETTNRRPLRTPI
jgi:hypothetical protein